MAKSKPRFTPDQLLEGFDRLSGDVALTPQETATVLGVSEKTLARRRQDTPDGEPRLVFHQPRANHPVRYRVEAIRDYLRKTAAASTGAVRERDAARQGGFLGFATHGALDTWGFLDTAHGPVEAFSALALGLLGEKTATLTFLTAQDYWGAFAYPEPGVDRQSLAWDDARKWGAQVEPDERWWDPESDDWQTQAFQRFYADAQARHGKAKAEQVARHLEAHLLPAGVARPRKPL